MKKILYTGGTFDLFHIGHINFLRQCRDIADVVVVSLNTDAFVEEFKRKPIMTFAERREALLHCEHVHAVVTNVGGKDSKITIETVQPNIIAIGSDWEKRDYHAQMGFTPEWLTERNIELVYLPYTEGVSTTDILKRIRA